MSILENLRPEKCATIAVDCLNTFMKADGKLSISAYQKNAVGLDQDEVQTKIDAAAKQTGELRRFLYDHKIPQIQFQDAHVVESIHGRRFHSAEIIREGEAPDFLRTFLPTPCSKKPPLRHPDQQAIPEIEIPGIQQVYIRWFDPDMPSEAVLAPERELIFMKDDFCMSPGSPFVGNLFWELRRQSRFYLIVFGVCDEICNLRNVLLMLASIFNVIYVEDCTFPLDPNKREPAITYMENFNPLGDGSTGQFQRVTSKMVMDHFQNI